jgi:16S rRNA (uracil1498-N3)-methyltransferase
MTRLLLPDEQFTANEISVQGDEFHYLTRVRRHKVRDLVEIRGASGRRVLCQIESIDRSRAVLVAERELKPVPSSRPVTLVTAVPKGHLLDDVVRKASEIGVARVIPVQTDRSVLKPGPGRLERWRKIATESLRQCGREKALIVDDVRPLDQALTEFGERGSRFILHPSDTSLSLRTALSRCDPELPIAVAIGPEGGFTHEEIDGALALNFQQVNLGLVLMRVETAAIAASVLCVAKLGGFESV